MKSIRLPSYSGAVLEQLHRFVPVCGDAAAQKPWECAIVKRIGDHVVIKLRIQPSLDQLKILRRHVRRGKQAKNFGKAPERVEVRALACWIPLRARSPDDAEDLFSKHSVVVFPGNLGAGDQVIKS